MFISGKPVWAQDILDSIISINFSKGIRVQVLDTIQAQSLIRLSYSEEVEPYRSVELTKGRYTVKELLDTLFNDVQIEYLVKGSALVLSPFVRDSLYPERKIIEGKIISKREKTVPFATLYIKGSSVGTIANAEGKFRFVLNRSKPTDTLVVSCMGYGRREILPKDYNNGYMVVKLEPSSIPIKDVIVRPENADRLIEQSLDLVHKNYNTKSTLFTAFFREASKQDNEYISLTEALIDINKSAYTSPSHDLIRLVKGRNGTNITKSELVNLVVEGGLYNGLRLDVVKYRSYFYDVDALELCDYKFLKTTPYNNRHTYIIAFNMKEDLNYPGFDGKLYIDAKSLALVRAEFKLSQQGIKYARSLLIKKTPKGFRSMPIHAKYEVEYRNYSGIWNLHYARSEISLRVRQARRKRQKGFSCVFNSTSEFVITNEIVNAKRKIKVREAVKSNDVLVKQVQETANNFWLEDNVIIPEIPLEKTISKLQSEGIIPD